MVNMADSNIDYNPRRTTPEAMNKLRHGLVKKETPGLNRISG
jgi:hypothetical protein